MIKNQTDQLGERGQGHMSSVREKKNKRQEKKKKVQVVYAEANGRRGEYLLLCLGNTKHLTGSSLYVVHIAFSEGQTSFIRALLCLANETLHGYLNKQLNKSHGFWVPAVCNGALTQLL